MVNILEVYVSAVILVSLWLTVWNVTVHVGAGAESKCRSRPWLTS